MVLHGHRLHARVTLALALVLAASLVPAAGVASSPQSVHAFTIEGNLGTPAPWQVSGPLGVDRTAWLEIDLPAGAVARVEATAENGTVHLYAPRGGGAAFSTYVVHDPAPAARKAITLAQDGVVAVDPGPGALYRIHVTAQGFWGDPATGGSAPVTVKLIPPGPCPLHALNACPP